MSGAITASVTTSGCLSPVALCTAGEFRGGGTGAFAGATARLFIYGTGTSD